MGNGTPGILMRYALECFASGGVSERVQQGNTSVEFRLDRRFARVWKRHGPQSFRRTVNVDFLSSRHRGNDEREH